MSRTRSSSSKSSTRPPDPPPPTWDERLINFLLPWRIEIAGLAIFLLAALTLLNLPGLTGERGWWAELLQTLFGWGAYPLFLSVAAAGVHLMLRQVQRPYRIQPHQVIGFELLLLTALPLTHLLTGASLPDAYRGRGGGLVGWALSDPLLVFLGPLLTGLLYFGLLAWALALLTGFSWEDARRWLQGLSAELHSFGQQIAPPEPEPAPAPPPPQPRLTITVPPAPDELVIIDNAAQDAPAAPGRRPKELPPLTLLEEGGVTPLTPEEIDDKKQRIEQTLRDFGLPATVTQIRRGPAVTQFGVEPGYVEKTGPDGVPKPHKVRVGQIAALQKDLALALEVQRLRVQAPVPGQGVVGIEVPNAETAVVRLRAVLETGAFAQLKSPLSVALGRDVSGAPVAVDLSKMPHLLIAGTTGSGKSVCINALVSC
ncbi:MAG: DNA translocase FtsK, partial [Anaerolineales bacterium]|nr:DNA translocase FtsK [Anaerolineales bacterium]